ncbi:MAG: GAF domain-containing protein, partial [candidate division NC10 bacterium]|nr:GAF domain-containing protein [candidate division NC10 bacterium]
MPNRERGGTPKKPVRSSARKPNGLAARAATRRTMRSGHSFREQETLAELERILNSSLDIQEVYPLFAERAATLIPFDRIAITLIDREKDYFTTLYEAGVCVPGRQRGGQASLAGTMTAAITTFRKTLLLQGRPQGEMADQTPGLLPELDAGLRSFLSVPLVVRDEVIGGINLRSRKARAYTRRHVQLAETLTRQIAPAIANACLFAEQKRVGEALRRKAEEAHQLARENVIVAEIGRIIGSTPSIEEVYARFSEKVKSLIPLDRISVTIFDDEQGETHSIRYVFGIQIPGRAAGDRVPVRGTLTGDVARERKGIILQMDDRQAVEANYPGLLPEWEVGIRSAMGVPLIARDRAFGALHFRSLRSQAYTDRHLRVAESVALQIAGAISNARLFAEQETAQAALRESEERYRLLVNNAEFPIVVTSLASGRVLFANERATALFGVPAPRAVGLRARDFWVRPESRDHFIDLLKQQGRVADYECELKDREGAAAWVLLSANIIDYAGERAAFVVYNEITGRKRAEEALRKSERHFRSLIENAGDAIYVLEAADGRVMDCNEQACLSTGYTREEILGRSISEIEVGSDPAPL